MKSYSYDAQDARGKHTKGVINAENEQEFLQRAKEKGLYIRDYKESNSGDSKSIYKFNTKELNFCCRQLSAMLTSGLTLVKAIDILTKEQENEKARAIWQDIYENVQKGESFSSTLQMPRMADHYMKENKLKNSIRSAMVYPIVLLVLCIVVVIFLFTFIMPTFIEMFEDKSKMPLLTKMMAAISDFLRTKWWLLIIIVIAAFVGFKYGMTVPSFRKKVHRMIIKGPGFGPLVTKIYTGRFARTLSSLYSSGIPMVECLERSSAILGNSYIDEKFENVIDEVKQGETLSSAITRTEIFEPMFCSVIYVGEEAGALDSILEKTSDYYEEESDAAVQRLVGIVQPVLLIFMGVIIGLVVCGVYPALYGSLESLENG